MVLRPSLARVLALALVLGLTPASAARAQEDRPVPDYDGRPEPMSVGDALLWVPRVVFYPVYLVTEYLVRRPLGALLTWAERKNLFGPQAPFGLFPTAFVEFSGRPSIGLYFFVNDFPDENDGFRLHFAWGGAQWWYLEVKQRFREALSRDALLAESWVRPASNELAFGFVLSMRPDHRFFGLGPEASYPSFTRYFRRQLGAAIEGNLIAGPRSGVALSLRLEDNAFGAGDAEPDNGELSIEQAFDVTDPDQVPGFDGYLLTDLGFDFVHDTRPLVRWPPSGLRFEIESRLAFDAGNRDRLWWRVGLEGSAFVAVSRYGDTLSARQYLGFIENLGSAEVPFTELVTLGGSDLLRGFPEGRYHGQSGWVSSVQYTYPIWLLVDGFVFFSVGNVFGEGLQGFSLGAMAASFGWGVKASWESDFALEVLVGAGTDRFEEANFGLEAIRFEAGVTRGF